MLSEENYRKILKKCWALPGISSEKPCYPEPVNSWILNKSKSLGVPFEYIAYPILSAVSYAMGKSVVNVTPKYKEPVIIYTLIAGRSGTNKSASLEVAKNLVLDIKEEDDVEPLFDTGTLEGLLSQLKSNNGSILCAPDEFSSFVDNMDKHGNGNSEKARYLSLHSGSSWVKRTKCGGNVGVMNPRFNFCSFIQNFPLANSMSHSNHYEGFYPRFLIAAPKEVFVKFADKLACAQVREAADMNQVMQNIYNSHHINNTNDNVNEYVLSAEAIQLLANYHDNIVIKHREDNPFEDLKTMVLSKSISKFEFHFKFGFYFDCFSYLISIIIIIIIIIPTNILIKQVIISIITYIYIQHPVVGHNAL